MPFGGATYDPGLDRERLTRQLGRVFECMIDGNWWTLEELQRACHRLRGYVGNDSQAGISARVRDLRKARFGGYTVYRRRRAVSLWEYQLDLTAPRKLDDEDGEEKWSEGEE